MMQFIYVLRLIPRLHKESNWTDEDNRAVEDHFVALQSLLKAGNLILAGRTQVALDSTFGIVIFEAESAEEAAAIMRNDPAVSRGTMTAELFPYQVALSRV